MRLRLGVHEETVEGGKELPVQLIAVVGAAEGNEHQAEDDGGGARLVVRPLQPVLQNVLDGDFADLRKK